MLADHLPETFGQQQDERFDRIFRQGLVKRALDEILGEGGWRSDPREQERIGFAAIERALATLASSDRGPAYVITSAAEKTLAGNPCSVAPLRLQNISVRSSPGSGMYAIFRCRSIKSRLVSGLACQRHSPSSAV